jgi:hypothetical protein
MSQLPVNRLQYRITWDGGKEFWIWDKEFGTWISTNGRMFKKAEQIRLRAQMFRGDVTRIPAPGM